MNRPKQKSPATICGQSLMDRQSKDTIINSRLTQIFNLFADGKSYSIPEIAEITGSSNREVFDSMKILLGLSVLTDAPKKEGCIFRRFMLRKEASDE